MSVFTSIYRQLTALDLDEIFSYQTTKEVRMLDRRLGMVNWTIRIIVLVYVIGYVVILREGYCVFERAIPPPLLQRLRSACATAARRLSLGSAPVPPSRKLTAAILPAFTASTAIQHDFSYSRLYSAEALGSWGPRTEGRTQRWTWSHGSLYGSE